VKANLLAILIAIALFTCQATPGAAPVEVGVSRAEVREELGESNRPA
jgi:hypothetical protein